MKEKLKLSLQPVLTVVVGLLLAYVSYFVARVVFVAENYALYADSLTVRHGWEMFLGSLRFDTSAILYTNVLWVLMVLFPLHLKERCGWHRACRLLFVVVNTLAFIANIADSVYFPFTLRRTTTTVFNEFSNEGNIGEIIGIEFLHHWYFLLITAAVVLLLWFCYHTPRLHSRRLDWRVHLGTGLLAILVFVPFCIAGMRGGWTRDIRPITISNANDYCNQPAETGIVLNTPFSLIRTIGKNNFALPDWFQDEAEVNPIFDPIHRPAADAGPMKQKNVVVLILESFGREYFGFYNRHLDGGTYQGYTPFLDSLLTHGALTFTHSYCNGRKSIDGMPSILSSIPMFVEPFFLSPYSVNHVSGLADCLGQKGWYTAFFHGAERGSMGFMAYARATRFADYFGREDYVADKRFGGDADYDGWWGISDEPFLQFYCAKMSEFRQPFMTALFTLSSHHPFRVPAPYADTFPETNPDMPIFKVVRYTDMALRHFFKAAAKQPWYDNTIFVITNDHTNMSCHESYYTSLGSHLSPVIFFDPSGEIPGGYVDAVAQQTDIMPTLLGHLGYDRPYLSFGKDLLATPPDSTWAVNYLNGIYQYVTPRHVLQFDGQHTTAVYALSDTLMQHNLVGQVAEQPDMERRLKAIVWQYMNRMINNRLTPDEP